MTINVDRAPDLGFQTRSERLDKLFEETAMSLTNLIVDTHTVLRKETKKIDLVGTSNNELLHAWLAEITFLLDYEHFLPGEFVVEIFHDEAGELRLRATVCGERIDSKRHVLRNRIKTVLVKDETLIECEDGTWVANVVVIFYS
ncbi:MAG TPA: archease [Candidatus Melainabacteria bacterium]|nr:archease [Candidatus Melainabacteria bacterium]